MFDLDQAIAEWRQQMLAAGIKTPAPLEELECHLRDDIDSRVRLGASPQGAFKDAVLQIGQPHSLQKEFKKIPPRVGHERLYFAILLLYALCTAANTCILYFWQHIATVSCGYLPDGTVQIPQNIILTTRGQLSRIPGWAIPLVTRINLVYFMAMFSTLLARRFHPKLGCQLARGLNYALLLAFPYGSLLGLYGLWKVDRRKAQSV